MKTDYSIIGSAPADIILGLVILFLVSALVLFVLSIEEEWRSRHLPNIRQWAAQFSLRLRRRRRWLFTPRRAGSFVQG